MGPDVTIGADSLRSEIRDKSISVIDVRRADDYMREHIPSSVNLPLADLLSDDDPQRVSKLISCLGIDDHTPVAVYDDTFGALASRVAWTIEYIGHPDVRLLDTTFAGWKSLGFECDLAAPDVHKKDHSVKLQPGMLATHDYLEEASARDDTILIDNRERLNYLEQHIPGAVSLPYRMLASKEKILRPPEEMKRMLDLRQIAGDSEMITYCGSVGTLSGLAYYALKSAKLPNIRLYVRSFKEWKSLNKPTMTQKDANYWDLSAE